VNRVGGKHLGIVGMGARASAGPSGANPTTMVTALAGKAGYAAASSGKARRGEARRGEARRGRS